MGRPEYDDDDAHAGDERDDHGGDNLGVSYNTPDTDSIRRKLG